MTNILYTDIGSGIIGEPNDDCRFVRHGFALIGSNGVGGTKQITVTHQLGTTPKLVICTVRMVNFTGTDAYAVTVRDVGSTTFGVNVYRTDNAGGTWGDTGLRLDWIAFCVT